MWWGQVVITPHPHCCHCHSGHHRSDTIPHADTSHNTGDKTPATCPQHTSSYPGPIIVSVWSLQTLSQLIFFSHNPHLSCGFPPCLQYECSVVWLQYEWWRGDDWRGAHQRGPHRAPPRSLTTSPHPPRCTAVLLYCYLDQ